jgi:OmpA-OmpF porin, OOP family
MKNKTLLLCTVALIVGAPSAYAENSASGPRYTPRPAVSQKNYTETNRTEDRSDAELYELYEQYEQREPCQHYRRLPRHYFDSCVSEDAVAVTEANSTETRLLPIVRSYTILFDFDKSAVRPDENETLSQIMHDINKYDPRQVTITGYTDSSGPVDYNQKLSREREQAVSKALLERGIQNWTLDREARGEYDQAVETADGVRNQQNRRVVIDFRR